MPKLEDLRTSLTELSADELRERIRAIREDRKIRKEGVKARKQRMTRTDRQRSKAQALFESMSPAEREAFLKSLEG